MMILVLVSNGVYWFYFGFTVMLSIVVLVAVMLSVVITFGLAVMLSMVTGAGFEGVLSHEAMMRVDTAAVNRIKFFIMCCLFVGCFVFLVMGLMPTNL